MIRVIASESWTRHLPGKDNQNVLPGDILDMPDGIAKGVIRLGWADQI